MKLKYHQIFNNTEDDMLTTGTVKEFPPKLVTTSTLGILMQ